MKTLYGNLENLLESKLLILTNISSELLHNDSHYFFHLDNTYSIFFCSYSLIILLKTYKIKKD